MELEALSLSVIDATFDFLNVSQNTANLITRVTKLQDQDSSQIHSKILGEKKRTEEWVNQMRGDHGVGLGRHLTQEKGRRISSLLLELNACYRRLDQTLQETVPLGQKGKGGRLIPTTEYNDLNNVLNTLTTINKTLREISSSPPSYSVVSDSMTTTNLSHPSTLIGHLSRSNSSLKSSSPEPRLFQAPTTIVEADRGNQRAAVMISVHYVWQRTLFALTTISVRRTDYKIARAASRLKLWGAGIFKMAVPLDEVFDAGGSILPLRRGILRVLVDILVWEEQQLNKLGLDELNNQRSQDRQMAKEITALLGTDDLISMALESWKDLVDEFEYDQIAQAPKGYDFVPGLVEVLYCLLPALKAARRGHCLRLTRDKAQPSRNNIPTFSSPTTAVSRSLGQHQETHEDDRKEVERIFEIAAELLAKRDKLATKKSKSAEKYAPWFERERVQLQAYILQQKSGTSMDPEIMKNKERRLREVLTEYVGQISKDPNIRDKLANLRPGKPKDKYLQDINRAREVINFLDASGAS